MCDRSVPFSRSWITSHAAYPDRIWPCQQEMFERTMRANYNKLMKWDEDDERRWQDQQAKMSFDEENIFEDFKIDDFIE